MVALIYFTSSRTASVKDETKALGPWYTDCRGPSSSPPTLDTCKILPSLRATMTRLYLSWANHLASSWLMSLIAPVMRAVRWSAITGRIVRW